jgi:alkylation response protein AidB-like acyl-CoA dehydrogenase
LVSLAVPALLAIADDDQKRARCAAVIGGEHRIAVAVAEPSGYWDGSHVALTARPASGGFELGGTKLFVPDARSADEIVVVARLEGDLAYFALPATTPGLTITPMQTVDQTRKLDVVELAGVEVDEDLLLGRRGHDASSLDAIVDVAKTALAAEMCGAADAALALSVDYVQVREQFGRAIATFQAIQHRLADMKVALENARSLVYYAAWAIDNDAPDRRLAAAMAKAYASDACTRIAADAIQVHGGIAFTWEHDMHLYFKRLKADEVTYGDATENRELVAAMLEL